MSMANSPRRRAPWLALLALGLFAVLAGLQLGGLTAPLDTALLQQAQQWRALHPAVEAALRDFSSLGGTPALTLFTVLAVAYLIAIDRPGRAAAVGLAMGSGALAVTALKLLFGRARPDPAFAALVQDGLSFPSGHASMSALFYLTVGVLLAQRHARRRERLFLGASAAFMAMLVGTTRVMLGVHWASDVLAGWAFGAGWAALWFLLAARLQDSRRGG